jgi:hypothetical protein
MVGPRRKGEKSVDALKKDSGYAVIRGEIPWVTLQLALELVMVRVEEVRVRT